MEDAWLAACENAFSSSISPEKSIDVRLALSIVLCSAMSDCWWELNSKSDLKRTTSITLKHTGMPCCEQLIAFYRNAVNINMAMSMI